MTRSASHDPADAVTQAVALTREVLAAICDLESPDAEVRASGVERLRELPTQRAVAPLARTLADPDPEVRALAAEALGIYAGYLEPEDLREAWQPGCDALRDPDEEVRDAAALSVRAMLTAPARSRQPEPGPVAGVPAVGMWSRLRAYARPQGRRRPLRAAFQVAAVGLVCFSAGFLVHRPDPSEPEPGAERGLPADPRQPPEIGPPAESGLSADDMLNWLINPGNDAAQVRSSLTVVARFVGSHPVDAGMLAKLIALRKQLRGLSADPAEQAALDKALDAERTRLAKLLERL